MSTNKDLDAEIIALDAMREQQEQARPPEYSDDALALRFAELHFNDLRYVAPWGKWMIWDGARWRFDDTLAAFDLARMICREAASRCGNSKKQKIASLLASAKTVAAVERLAKTDRRMAATIEQWDADQWSLNTPGGVVDLRTGKIRPHRPSDYLTKITAVAPSAEDCPRWQAHLDLILKKNDELKKYLQRLFGYTLTGDTSEQALFFGYGTGANGKGVTVNTCAGILQDYSQAASIEAFTASHTDRHPTELAALRGARLVTATETEEGRRWAESRLKMLTGGDPIRARFMRQDEFEFMPQLKLLISGNHKPSLRSVNEAIRRRFHLIPFTVTIPEDKRDQDLAEKLKDEWPAIFGWMIDGCLMWQRDGLNPPAAVRDATKIYLDAQDNYAAWIEEKCERDPNHFESRAALFASWSAWAIAAGEYVGTRTNFLEALANHDCVEARDHTDRGFRGLRIIPPPLTPHWTDRDNR